VTDAPLHASRRLYLIDGSGFIFRAFHALPPMNRKDGTPTNAVLGFVNMMLKLLTDFHAGQIAVIFDAKRANFRNDIYSDYKANRAEAPDELVPQFPLIREAVEAFSLPSLELEGYEADDLIATYARLAKERGQDVTIVSSDKDLMQLIEDGIEMFDPIKQRTIGRGEVIEKFGVPPEKMIEVQALIGDKIDNVPGVPGIGVKTAAELIGAYGDLETLLSSTASIKQEKRRQLLIEHADAARMSRKLVTLDKQVPVPKALEELVVAALDEEKLLEFCRRMEFRSIVARLEGRSPERQAAPLDIEPAPAEAEPPLIEASYELVQTIEALQRWIARAHETGYVAIDTETDSLAACSCGLVGISLALAPGEACYIPLCHVSPDAPQPGGLLLEPMKDAPPQIPMQKAIALLKPLLEDPAVLKIGHNLKFDLQVLAGLGVTVSPIDDTMLLSYVLDGTAHGHGMDELAGLFLSHKTITYNEVTGTGKARVTFDRVPLDKALTYAAEDADVTLRLHHFLKKRLLPERMTTLYETIERRLVPVVAEMERTGIKVDRPALKGLSERFAIRLAEREAEIHRLAGRSFNVGSPKQLGQVLFGEMGIPGGGKTKTGDWSTDAGLLEKLAEEHEIVARVMEWRQTSKLKSTYTDALQEEIDAKTGRVHTSYSLAATSTGRLSSTGPNLQNIPIRTDEGKEIRRAFIAEEGYKLLSADYSQIELRLAAEIAGIEALREAFRSGADIHALTASQVFGVPMAEMTGDLRRAAKAINFGIIYGISGFGLAKQLGISSKEAGTYIAQYLDRFSELRVYMEETKTFARENGFVLTLYGRKCFIPGITDRNAARRAGAERQAINARLQGTAADIMRKAMVNVANALQREKLGARLLLQVHDELVLEVPDAEIEETRALVKSTMEHTVRLGVPLVADAGIGVNWGEAH
jgi:DNA polymerase-1